VTTVVDSEPRNGFALGNRIYRLSDHFERKLYHFASAVASLPTGFAVIVAEKSKSRLQILKSLNEKERRKSSSTRILSKGFRLQHVRRHKVAE
jgi:hypothetical protein